MLNDEIDSDNEEDYGQTTLKETNEIEIDETAAEKKLRYRTVLFNVLTACSYQTSKGVYQSDKGA